MIIDPKKEFIALQEQEYRDFVYLVEALLVSETHIKTHYIHKSAYDFIKKAREQIKEAEEKK